VEFENQINRISTQLEYERKREEQLQQNVQKFERMVQDIEDQMEAARKAEQSQMHEIDMEMREVEKLKSEKQFLKSEVDKIEDEVRILPVFFLHKRYVGATSLLGEKNSFFLGKCIYCLTW
jgi:predicted  nucleic acid-binding Zn-ribbon protein